MDLNSTFFFCCCCCFFFVLVVPQSGIPITSYVGIPYRNCLHNTTTLSSAFKGNLTLALSKLADLAFSGTKYAKFSTGSGDDIVYAMFQCRGDQTMKYCAYCMASATTHLLNNDCPNSIGARIQLDGCYLHYDNQPFFTPDFSFIIGYCYAKTSDPVTLATIESILENVTTRAPKQGGFASASAEGEYAAAQCLGYLNESECSQCLSSVPYGTVCDASLGEQVHLTSCYYRYEPYNFLETQAQSPSPLASHLAPSSASPLGPMPLPHQGSKPPILVIGGIVGAIVVIVALCIILVRLYNGRKTRGMKWVKKGGSWHQSHLETKGHVFLLQELEEATRNFHPNNKLGQGGFGPVYKGTLSNGEQVAVKKLAIGSQQGKIEFLNEVNLITSVQHKNLIRLLGSCMEGHERILVYEYLPNKSLDFFLFGEARDDKTLDWSSRFGIVLGMAKGLAYLHEESHVRIIHRDIKPSNILLDDQLNPVIADFGLARLVQNDESQINTRLAGTIGYLAPEYAMHGQFSAKVDVFSFGLVSLEIISGKKNLNSWLLPQVWELYLQNRVLDLVDEKLRNSFLPEEAIRVIHVALLCTQENPKQRPTMSRATVWLLGKAEILEIPHKPAFVEMNEARVSPAAMNYHWSHTSSLSSSEVNHIPRDKCSHISGGTQSVSKIDPR